MITINTIQISNDSTSIEVDITIPSGDNFVSAKLWTSSNYKSTTDFTDLASYLPAGPQFTNTTFSIPATDIGKTVFNGVFYLEIISEDIGEVETSLNTAISNLTAYHLCMLGKVQEISIVNCKPVATGDCGCEDNPVSNVTYINTLLESLYYGLEVEYYQSTAKIENELIQLCTSCCSCAEFTNTDNFSGTYFTADTFTVY